MVADDGASMMVGTLRRRGVYFLTVVREDQVCMGMLSKELGRGGEVRRFPLFLKGVPDPPTPSSGYIFDCGKNS